MTFVQQYQMEMIRDLRLGLYIDRLGQYVHYIKNNIFANERVRGERRKRNTSYEYPQHTVFDLITALCA